ncbi:FtsX-like permease family protein [Halioglobus maricola]|uniref:FtsX-like permease family protein n=1 Tax=Halioglobus maricola TaxID=2601894 RepID=A0A5P9NPY1_9GAMM|nr:ABC transporter permease DevC [Halioglobus maricola]QFU77832.1 FtsX-like permease family protein [Halioglobus maricola]
MKIAWVQISHQKLRLVAAVLGVAFAVILVLVQLGFSQALYDSSVRWHTSLGYDLALISPKTTYIVNPPGFPRNRLYQTLGVEGVESVTPVYIGIGKWRNPDDPLLTRNIYVMGFDPTDSGFSLIGDARTQRALRHPDRVLFDRLSRSEFGPVAGPVQAGEPVNTEINGRDVRVVGLFSLGTSFGIDGSIITSDLNFRRIFPDRSASRIELGLINLEEGADPVAVQRQILANIPADVRVLTKDEFVQHEVDYWARSTPIGYVFGLGVVMGLAVGVIVVYQILFSDVQDHLREYATLKAIGYSNMFLSRIVLSEAVLLAFIGFIPGLGISLLVYGQASGATNLPMEMTPERGGQVLLLTIAMCAGSGLLALRKLRAADPAEVF